MLAQAFIPCAKKVMTEMATNKRRFRYGRWLDKCHEYLRDTGDVRTAQWLFENIGYNLDGTRIKNALPPNVNSAAQKLTRDKRFTKFPEELLAYNRKGDPYRAHGWGVSYEE